MTAHQIAPIALPDKPRILVISLRRIGDVLLTTPLIRSLRRAWPGATIEALVFAGTAGIVEGNPDIDRVATMPSRPSMGDTIGLAARLFKRFDLAISTQTGDRPSLFAVLAGRRSAGIVDPFGSGLARKVKRAAFHYSVPMDPDIHRVEQVLRIADSLGIARVPHLVCPTRQPPSARENFAVIHAAPMFRYKQWTRAGWRGLAAGLTQRGLSVVAIGGPDPAERRYLDDLWAGVTEVQQASWPKTVDLLRRARVYIGPDTSVTHLAAAAGCPTVALFGPMDPRVWGPWPVGGMSEPWAASGTIQHRGNVWIVQNPLPCVPCTFEGCERHLESPSVCLDELSVDQVLTAVDLAHTSTAAVAESTLTSTIGEA